MKKITIYASRPRKMFGSTFDLDFLKCLKYKFNSNTKIIAEGHDFKYVPSIDMMSKIEKIVSNVDKLIVLHIDGVIDQNQYYEVTIALMENIPVFAINIRSSVVKEVIGFDKYFDTTINKGAILKFKGNTPK